MKPRTDPLLAWQVTWVGLTVLIGVVTVTTASWELPLFELMFLFWFVGFLAGVELFSPRHRSPDRWLRVRWILVAGLTVTTLVIARRVLVLL